MLLILSSLKFLLRWFAKKKIQALKLSTQLRAYHSQILGIIVQCSIADGVVAAQGDGGEVDLLHGVLFGLQHHRQRRQTTQHPRVEARDCEAADDGTRY